MDGRSSKVKVYICVEVDVVSLVTGLDTSVLLAGSNKEYHWVVER